ncbi:MAG: LptF/LptG family permease [Phycisphaeraceae bacterium]|nr:LptF/LptG family permease [Phycisphaeraceae bacterium]
MPWIIYRYILRDLVKLFLLSASVLVSIMSVAAAIKPLSEGLLRPEALPRFLFFTSPTMLQFAAPFAAAFAATAVFSRLKNDNEILACSVGGLSYRALLFPALFAGFVLTLGLFYSSNWWIPRFYHRQRQLLFSEDPQILLNLINRGQAFNLEDWVVYADSAQKADIPPQALAATIPPTQRLVLQGVAASRFDESEKLRAETTAQLADVFLFRHEDQTWVTMRLHNVMFFRPDEGVLVASADFEVRRQRLLNALRDDPQFLTWPQLRRLADAPERFDRVASSRRDLYFSLVGEQILRDAQAQLKSDSHRGSLAMVASDDRTYRLSTPRLDRRQDTLFLQATADRPVLMLYQVPGATRRTFEARTATLRVDQVDDPNPDVRLFLDLFDVSVIDPRTSTRSSHSKQSFPLARWPTPVLPALAEASTADLIAFASRGDWEQSATVRSALEDLRATISRLMHRAIAQLHDRAASSLSALLIILLAATFSLLQRGGPVLVTFFWTFLFTTASIICVEGGRELITRPDASIYPGLVVLWAGNLLLILAVLGGYVRLIRN